MNRVWTFVLLTIAMVASLMLFSCQAQNQIAPATATTTANSPVPKTTAASSATTTAASEEKPVYGGQLTLVLSQDPTTFNEAAGMMSATAYTEHLTNEELVTGDWARGPAGTGEFDWTGNVGAWNTKAPSLAESWDLPQPGHVIFHIRQGVHYALNPGNAAADLVNGRELTADDVVYTLKLLQVSPMSAPHYSDFPTANITEPDKWTVDIEIAPQLSEEIDVTSDFASIMAPEVIEKFGNVSNWQLSVGTGPFILKDYVNGSSAYLIRNPNYWRTDPIGPGKGDQLPYLDSVNMLIIPDVSTQLAAMRTKKADILNDITWENAKSLQQSNPQLMSKQYYENISQAVAMRIDKSDLPYHDIRVRQALMMATDFDTIKNTYCGGEAQIESWPIVDTKAYNAAYLPLDQAPASVQALYKYNPDQAKTLLAQAGYPNGFKANMIVVNTNSAIDYASILKQMWAKVGVDVILQPTETGAYNSITASRNYPDMIMSGPGPVSDMFIGFYFYGDMAFGNLSYISDPTVDAARTTMMTYSMTDPAKAYTTFKDLMPYVLAQAWAIPCPTPPTYSLWWPWIKNYQGETSVGFGNEYNYAMYAWLDQAMKQQMGG